MSYNRYEIGNKRGSCKKSFGRRIILEQTLSILNEYGALIGVIIGGLCTIYGSYLSANKQAKSQKEIFDEEISLKNEDLRWQLKYSLLVDFIGNRGALVIGNPNIINASDPVKFFNALNRIEIVFYDSEAVLEKNKVFRIIILDPGKKNLKDTNDALYDLAVAMHEDLGIQSPDKKSFLNPLMINVSR